MSKKNRVWALLLTIVTAISFSVPVFAARESTEKYDYNFENDSLGLAEHENGRTFASPEIAALAAQYGGDSDAYLDALGRAGIIAFILRDSGQVGIIAGPYYPHGGEAEKPAAPEPSFTKYGDVPSWAWYYDAVMEIAEGGLVYGNEYGNFCPKDNVTVAELATVLCRIYGLPTAAFGGPWYGPYIDTLLVADLAFSSCERERANEDVTRGEAIEAILVMAKALGRERERSLTWARVEDSAACRNAPAEHTWSAAALLDALNWGVIDGVNAAHRVDAGSPLTRAELCKMLQNAGITRAGSVDAYKAVGICREYAGMR